MQAWMTRLSCCYQTSKGCQWVYARKRACMHALLSQVPWLVPPLHLILASVDRPQSLHLRFIVVGQIPEAHGLLDSNQLKRNVPVIPVRLIVQTVKISISTVSTVSTYFMYFNVFICLYFNTFVFQRILQYMFQRVLHIFQYER